MREMAVAESELRGAMPRNERSYSLVLQPQFVARLRQLRSRSGQTSANLGIQMQLLAVEFSFDPGLARRQQTEAVVLVILLTTIHEKLQIDRHMNGGCIAAPTVRLERMVD